MSRIAITGSSGLIGRELVNALSSAGREVVRVRRGNPSDPSATWNPESGWFRENALAGCGAVVHLAGASVGEGRWTAKRKQELVDSRVKGTRLLVDHLASLEQRPAVLVAASAVGSYGDAGDRELDESSPKGEGFLADLVEKWETEVMRANDLGVRAVALRFGVVLDRRGGALKKMLLPFKVGAGGRLGSGKQWMPTVSLVDATRAIIHAIDTPTLAGPANVATSVTNAAYTAALGSALRRPTFMPVPTLGLKLLFGGEQAEEMLLSSQRVVSRKLEASGFVFTHPGIESQLDVALRGPAA